MRFRRFLNLMTILTAMLPCGLLRAQEAVPAPAAPVGQFVTLTSPISDTQVARVTNLAVQLQTQAEKEDREAVLVVEIPSGSSRFGQVSDLARALTTADVSRVRTVAWVPKSVRGNHAIVALACHDIVMDPDASLGDIGRGEAVPSEEQDFILNIVDRRRNSRMSRGIVMAMMNPSVELLRVQMKGAAGIDEQRFLTAAELTAYRNRNAEISETEVIKDAGAPGAFNASDAVRSGFMVARTVENRRDVAAMYDLPLQSMREEGRSDKPANVRVIAVHDVITPVTEEFVLRQIRTAVSDGATVLIFDIDSPGGYLDSSESLATTIADLDPRKVTTVAWIADEAISGAAITALGCDQIIMKPTAQIGDAGVIQETQEGGAFERVPEKLVGPFLTFMGDLARAKNRPPALLQARVDRNLEVFQVTNSQTGAVTYMSQYEIDEASDVWVKGNIVPESRQDMLLTVNGERAHELGLAEPPCADLDELRLRLGLPEDTDLTPVTASWVDTMVFMLRSGFGGFALITLGILCMYVELHLPSGFFGILSAIFFALFFWSRYLGGTAGTLELVMFVLGIGLLLMEIFLIPGFGVFGVTGILLMFGSLVMASHTFSGMSAGESFEKSMGSLGTLAGALVTVIVVATVLNRFLPSIPFLNRLILTPPGYVAADENSPHLNPELLNSGLAAGPVTVGQRGIASSTLRPSGKGSFGEQFLDVVSDGAYIDHGTLIEVIRVSGNRVVVRPVDDETEATG
ncbi:MAG: NfeD family protein [Planctomycetaceae bacterium]